MADKMSQSEIDALLKQLQSGTVKAEEMSKLSGDEYICVRCYRTIKLSTYKGVKPKDIIFLNGCNGQKHKYVNVVFLKEYLKNY